LPYVRPLIDLKVIGACEAYQWYDTHIDITKLKYGDLSKKIKPL
jgi:hypothetical protein